MPHQPPPHCIVFFSSDITALYKKDILSVLSLPRGYCIHFRYATDDIGSNVLPYLPNVIGRAGVIVYTIGNNPALSKQNRQVRHFPIRKVTISNYRQDDQTQLHHFNLELGDFVTCGLTYAPGIPTPPYKFVVEGDIGQSAVTRWTDKIDEIAQYDTSFQKRLFYNFRLLPNNYDDGFSLDMPFDKREEASYFHLQESKSFILDLSIYITDDDEKEYENYLCGFEYEKKSVLIASSDTIIIGSKKDNRRFKLITTSIEHTQVFDYLNIKSSKKESGTITNFYETVLRFNVKKSLRKLIFFTLFFSANLIGAAWFAYVITNDKNMYAAILPILMIIGAAVGQYYYHNKSN